MPAITAQEVRNTEASELTQVTLDGATDTFTFNNAKTQLLVLTNTTGSPVVVTMVGDGASGSFTCPGYGVNDVDPVSISVAANAVYTQYLNAVGNILKGETTITNGLGLTAAIMNMG